MKPEEVENKRIASMIIESSWYLAYNDCERAPVTVVPEMSWESCDLHLSEEAAV